MCAAVLCGAIRCSSFARYGHTEPVPSESKASKSDEKKTHTSHPHTPHPYTMVVTDSRQKTPVSPTHANHPPLHSVPLALGSTKHYSTMGAAVPLSSFLLSAAPPVRRRSTCELSNRSTFAYCASSVEAFEAFYVVVMFLLLLYTFCQLSPGQASVLGGR